MSNDGTQRERDFRERIANLIRANEPARKKQCPPEELQKLRNAASRLDQMLQDAADAETLALKHAAARLDRLLANLHEGNDVTSDFRRRAPTAKPRDE